MPTRIVLRETAPSAVDQGERPRIGSFAENEIAAVETAAAAAVQDFQTPTRRRGHGDDDDDLISPARSQNFDVTTPARPSSKKKLVKGVVGFRDSIAREAHKKDDEEGDEQSQKPPNQAMRHDIRGSTRLQGYLFEFTAAMVLMISAVEFFRGRDPAVEIRRVLEEANNCTDSGLCADGDGKPNIYTQNSGIAVLTWKLYGAIIIGAAGSGVSLFIILVHFDTIFFPRFWRKIFRDGSKWERNLLLLSIVYWAAGLEVCTSTFSVGEAAINVYFTTWIAFGATVLNYQVWRTSANLPPLGHRIESSHRETTHNWAWTLIFSTIAVLATAEMYINRDDLKFVWDGEYQEIPQVEWNKGLAATSTAFAVSAICLLCNHYLTESFRLKLGQCCTLNLDWKQAEGLLLVALVGTYFWIIFEYTGVNTPINQPSNAYFGIWGVFFTSIFTFGTWLREIKNIKFFSRNTPQEE